MGWGLPVLHWCFQKPPQPQHCLRGPLRGPLGPSRGWRGSAPGLAQVRQPRPPVAEPRLPGRPALPGTSSPPRRQLNPACAAPEAAAVVRRHGLYRGPAALRPHVPRPRARLSLLRFRLSCPSDVLAAQTWCYISIRKMRPRGPWVPPCPLKLQFRFFPPHSELWPRPCRPRSPPPSQSQRKGWDQGWQRGALWRGTSWPPLWHGQVAGAQAGTVLLGLGPVGTEPARGGAWASSAQLATRMLAAPPRARGPGRWGLAVLTPFRTPCFQALTPLTGHCFLLFLNRFYWCSLRANDSFDEFQ